MKTFIRWLIIHVILFAAVAVGTHMWLKNSPKRILVAVDSSYDMIKGWPALVELVDSLDDNPGPYVEFALITDKGPVHGWQKTLELKTTVPYGPRALEVFEDETRYPLIDEATDRILITNERSVKGLGGWSIQTPQ